MINVWLIVVFFVCLLLAALFCSAETAFISIQKLRLKHLIRMEKPGAQTVAKIVEHPEKFLATVLLGINFFETAVATVGTLIALSLWRNYENLATALATIAITIITLIFAELIPKSLAARFGEKMALAYARPIQIVALVLYPFVFILRFIGVRFTKLAGDTSEIRPTMSTEEFRTAIEVGEKEGVVEEEAAEMLHNVFEFGNRPVREVMIPRPDVVSIERGTNIAGFLEKYAASPLSRYPVYEGNMDYVIGILSIKDVLMAQAKGTINNESLIDTLIRPAYFTPETKPISQLFIEMKDSNYRMAVVVDEFGGTAGVVSLTQLVEEVVGPVGDELAQGEKEFEVIDEHTYQVDAGMRIEEINEEMNLRLPEGDYETIAGFILSLLGRIPKQGENLRYHGLKMVITRMRGPKIEEILITREKDKIPVKGNGEKDAKAQDQVQPR
jgi:putative hemolysin